MSVVDVQHSPRIQMAALWILELRMDANASSKRSMMTKRKFSNLAMAPRMKTSTSWAACDPKNN